MCDIVADHDLTSQVEASAILPAALETVRSRTQLAQVKYTGQTVISYMKLAQVMNEP